MRQEKPKTRYVAYLLRLWETTDEDHPIWRASLECPGTGERYGFATLHDLFVYLEAALTAEPPQDDER